MKHSIPDHSPLRDQYLAVAEQAPKHFALSMADGVASESAQGQVTISTATATDSALV